MTSRFYNDDDLENDATSSVQLSAAGANDGRLV